MCIRDRVEDVNMAYIGDNIWAFSELNGVRKEDESGKLTKFFEYASRWNMVIYTEQENIKGITDLHRELMNNREYCYSRYGGNQAVVAYWMKDGSVVVRDSRIDDEAQMSPANQEKDRLAEPVVKSDEFKRRRFPFLYSDIISSLPMSYNIITEEGATVASGKDRMEELRECLRRDVDRIIGDADNSFEYLIMGDHLFTGYNFYDGDSHDEVYIIYLENAMGSKNIEIYADEMFVDTIKFIENIK